MHTSKGTSPNMSEKNSLCSRYSDDARNIVKHVLTFCKEEKENGMKIPLTRTLDRSCALTGVSVSTIKRMTRPDTASVRKQPPSRITQVDDFDEGVIRRTINAMYVNKTMLPTLNNIKVTLQDNMGLRFSKSHLRKQLKMMGFRYGRCKLNCKVLMERPDVVLHRIQYLRRIKDLRDVGHTIVYTDETYVHTNHGVSKCWQDDHTGLKIPFSKGERMILLHAGTSAGFIPGAELVFKAKSSSGDYHSEMNHDNFMKWLQEMLIPNLPANSVLVLDNAAYHNVQVDRCPTTASRKGDIQDWLTRRGINYDPTMLKAELLHICKQHKQQPRYVLDEVLASHGHQAVRLPPYHADLNPIELIWGNLKGFVARHNLQFNLTTIKVIINEGFKGITSIEWTNCIQHVIEIERKYWSIDIAVDKLVDPVVINFDSDSEDISNGSSTDTVSEDGSCTDTASEGEA